ncbi:hypothetical protein [Streptomyces antibioticus]|uniref:hypothetical protein n=1 Tax=Streptomyces antibioticus TaxID=1890 RepID=UPI0033EE0BB3
MRTSGGRQGRITYRSSKGVCVLKRALDRSLWVPRRQTFPEQPAEPAARVAGHKERPARVLLGWLPAAAGEALLEQYQNGLDAADRSARISRAREAVEARSAGVDQTDLVSPVPPELADYVARLDATLAGTERRREGRRVAMVDLERVVAFQPHVFTDALPESLSRPGAGAIEDIAAVTLPLGQTETATSEYDSKRKTYTVTSRSRNLRILGKIGGKVPQYDGKTAYGFVADVGASFVEVVRFQDRYLLYDGYHRAFGLLSRGISRVPAFVRDSETLEGLVPEGMLPENTWLGERPPMLSDYLDDRVVVSISLPVAQRMIVIQALELSTPGFC